MQVEFSLKITPSWEKRDKLYEQTDVSISDDYGKDSTLHDIVKDLKKWDRLTDSLSFESSEFKSHKGEKENFNIFKTHQYTKRKFEIDSSFNNELYGEMNWNSEIIASDDIEAEEVIRIHIIIPLGFN